MLGGDVVQTDLSFRDSELLEDNREQKLFLKEKQTSLF
jgi:hypothetical protein